ncbi:MAG: nuclear transport factor 2 family protein [Acidimicrobiia bacterium]|jgi:hypothetical protein
MIDDLITKQTITEVIYRYCRALDRMDRPLADTLWHPDGTADYGPAMFQGTGAEFLDWVWQAHAAMLGHSHQISNVLIEVDADGDGAGSEAYVTATLWAAFAPDELTQIVSRGRYVDRWSRRAGLWAIDHRRFVEDFTTTTVLPGAAPPDPGATAARRDRTDPSYDVLDH